VSIKLCVSPAGPCSSRSCCCCCDQGDSTGAPQAAHAGPAEQGSTKGLVGCYAAQDPGLYRLQWEAAAAAAELGLVCLEILRALSLGARVVHGGSGQLQQAGLRKLNANFVFGLERGLCSATVQLCIELELMPWSSQCS
jgi:hypothetical protein